MFDLPSRSLSGQVKTDSWKDYVLLGLLVHSVLVLRCQFKDGKNNLYGFLFVVNNTSDRESTSLYVY